MGLRHSIDIRIAYHPQFRKCNPASFICTIAFHAHDNIRGGCVFIPMLQMKKASLSKIQEFAQNHSITEGLSWNSEFDSKVLTPELSC